MNACSPLASNVTRPLAEASVSEYGVESVVAEPEVVTHEPSTMCADVIEYAE